MGFKGIEFSYFFPLFLGQSCSHGMVFWGVRLFVLNCFTLWFYVFV